MHWIRTLAVSVAVMLSSGTALASGKNALDFLENTGQTAANFNQSVGWIFNVNEEIFVTGLQWFDDGGNGLTIAHEVGIWNPAGLLLSSTVIPAGVAAPLVGQWRTIKVDPFILNVANGYIVGGYNGANAVDRLAFGVTQMVNPSITHVNGTFSFINGIFERPINVAAGQPGLYGPSFQFIPAPGSLVLLGLGGLVVKRRRRR